LATNLLIRFAGYQLDPGARSLKQDGRPIPLSPKSFDLLVFLAQHPHQVVTKEELLAAVWPNSFVEESNLSQHVFLLRKALANGGHGEQLIVTVPGKGYQFAAAVEQAPQPLANQAQGGLLLHAVQSVTRLVVEEESDDETPALRNPADRRQRRRRLFWMAGSAALVLVAGASFLGWQRLHPARGEHIDLVLSELENTTGDSDFDRVLNQALTIDLEQSPFLNLLSRSRIRETLAEMQRPKDEVLTPSLARELCERNNAQAVLHGTVARFGSKYVLILDADSCVNGKQIAGYKTEVESKEEVLPALDTAAAQVRKQLGESRASLERFQTPIAQATTPSLEALRAYSQAGERFEHGDMRATQGLLEHAIALDPNFASAYRALGGAYYNRADFAQATTYIRKAFDLRDRTTERERLSIEIAYHAYGDFDYEATIRSMKLFNQIYPNNASNWGNLCNMYTQLGAYDDAIAAGEQAHRIDSHQAIGAEILARAYKRANRFADAKRVANASFSEGKDHFGTHSILFQIAYAEHDAAKIKTEGEWGLTHQFTNQSLDDLGFAAATGGRLREASDNFSRSRIEALRGGDTDFAESVLLDQSAVEIELGEAAKATETLKQLKDAGAQSQDIGTLGEIAFRKAELGDLAPAEHFVATAENGDNNRNTILLNFQLPLLRALLALKAHKAAEAVHMLEPARPFQLRDFTVLDLRAQAETQAGNLDAAAIDYRLILNNQGVDPISPLYSIAHLRLARILATQKKIDEARGEYQAFFEAWKDADSGLSMLGDAKREFAQLH
jgi:eukaryotic-like serine/threonine-protein kinase